jgi:hypothetical protein
MRRLPGVHPQGATSERNVYANGAHQGDAAEWLSCRPTLEAFETGHQTSSSSQPRRDGSTDRRAPPLTWNNSQCHRPLRTHPASGTQHRAIEGVGDAKADLRLATRRPWRERVTGLA